MDRSFFTAIGLILFLGLLILGMSRQMTRMYEHQERVCADLPTEAERDYCRSMVGTGMSAGW